MVGPPIRKLAIDIPCPAPRSMLMAALTAKLRVNIERGQGDMAEIVVTHEYVKFVLSVSHCVTHVLICCKPKVVCFFRLYSWHTFVHAVCSFRKLH